TLLCAWGDGKCIEATGAGFAGRPDEHALSGQQPTASVAGGLCLPVAGAFANSGLDGNGTGASDGRDRPAQDVESGRAGARECPASVCATKQRLSLARLVPVLSSAADVAGYGHWMTPIRLQRDAPPRRRCLQKRRKNIFGPPTAPSFSKTTTSAPLFPPFHNPSPQKPFRYEISGLVVRPFFACLVLFRGSVYRSR